ncbi:MAG: hypothetical protein ACK5KO_03950 [Arachnia sp.]
MTTIRAVGAPAVDTGQGQGSLTQFRVVVVVVVALELATRLLRLADGSPAQLAMCLAASAAAVVALWRPLIGAGVLMGPLLAAAVLGEPGLVSLALLVVMLAVAITHRFRVWVAAAGVVAAGIAWVWRLAPDSGQVLAWALALSLLVGLMGRGYQAVQRSGERRIQDIRRSIHQLRRRERVLLADELATLLRHDLDRHESGIRRALAVGEPAGLSAALALARDDSRAALTQLREIVGALRGRGRDPRLRLATTLEHVEDVLVEYGHRVELNLDDLGSVPPQTAEVAAACLTPMGYHLLRVMPEGATARIDVSCEPGCLRVRVAGPGGHGQDLAAQARRDLVDEVAALAGRVETSTRDGWTGQVWLPIAPATPPQAAVERPASRRPGTLPLTRGILAAAVWLAAAVQAGGALGQFLAGRGGIDGALWAWLWLAVGVCLWRPRIGAALLLSGAAASLLASPEQLSLAQPGPAALIAFTALMASLTPRRLPMALLVWTAYGAGWAWSMESAPRWDTLGQFVLAVVVAAMFLMAATAGLIVRHVGGVRRYQRSELARLGAERDQAQERERQQLAGHLHDVVAHRLSRLSLQAAQQRDSGDVAELRRAAADVASAYQEIRDELAALVRVLPGEPGPALPPGWDTPRQAAGSAGHALRLAGFHPSVEVGPGADRLDASAATTLGRILREGTTNVIRYAEPGSACLVRVAPSPHEINVEILSRLASQPRADQHSGGNGLRGLQERAHLTGARLEAGVTGQQWRLSATIPRHQGPARGAGSA